jgi:uridine kinase
MGQAFRMDAPFGEWGTKIMIIGIAGGTGSGKTTVVRKILESLEESTVAVIPQDSYYNDQSHLPLDVRKKTNFDHPDAFEWSLLSKHIAELKAGRAIEQPTYSYLTCTRLEDTVHVEPKEVIIVEGIMALYDKNIRDQMDLKIFVDATPDERLLRVIVRDIAERGHPLEMLIDKYRNVLKPMHDEFIEPTKQYADIIIPNGGNNVQAIEMMRMYITAAVKERKNRMK